MDFFFCRCAAEVASRDQVFAGRCTGVANWELPAGIAIPGLHDPDGMALMALSLAGTIGTWKLLVQAVSDTPGDD
jgi:hypothetical protein